MEIRSLFSRVTEVSYAKQGFPLTSVRMKSVLAVVLAVDGNSLYISLATGIYGTPAVSDYICLDGLVV
jgi:hypothetical protein